MYILKGEACKFLGTSHRSFVGRDGQTVEYDRVRFGLPDYTSFECSFVPSAVSDYSDASFSGMDVIPYFSVSSYRGKPSLKLVSLEVVKGA